MVWVYIWQNGHSGSKVMNTVPAVPIISFIVSLSPWIVVHAEPAKGATVAGGGVQPVITRVPITKPVRPCAIR